MQVNSQGFEHGLQRIEQIYSRLYDNEDTLGETKLDTEMEKKFRVNMLTSIQLQCSSQSDMQSKQKPCASIAARLHGAAHAAVGYSTRSIFYTQGAFYISAILQTALNVKGYPHLPVCFYRRLQFSEHKLSQEKNHG